MEKNWIGKARHAPLLVALIAAVAVFGISPAHAAGKTQTAPTTPPPSATDTDSDGLLDSSTTAEATVTFSNVTGTSAYSQCSGSPTGTTRNNCLDVNGKDVFVFVKKEASSQLPLDGGQQVDLNALLEPVWRAPNTGLGVAVHRLIPSNTYWSATSRSIPGDTRTHPQMAIFITESLDNTTDLNTLGTSGVGTPNYAGGDITIFTKRIRKQVTDVCTAGIACTDINGATTIDQVVRNWQIHVASHEVAHSLNLRNPQDPTYGEHYATATKSGDLHTILEQGMFKTYSSGTAKFYISLDFTSAEPGHWTFYIP